MAYTSSQVVQAVPTGINSALVYIGGGSLNGTATTTFSNVFSATYDSYRIYLINMSAASGTPIQKLQLGSATTDYESTNMYCNNSATWTFASSPTANFEVAQMNSTDKTTAVIDIVSPFLTEQTFFTSLAAGYGTQRDMNIGLQDSATSFTAFTIFNSSSANTTGTVRIYGYTNS